MTSFDESSALSDILYFALGIVDYNLEVLKYQYKKTSWFCQKMHATPSPK